MLGAHDRLSLCNSSSSLSRRMGRFIAAVNNTTSVTHVSMNRFLPQHHNHMFTRAHLCRCGALRDAYGGKLHVAPVWSYHDTAG